MQNIARVQAETTSSLRFKWRYLYDHLRSDIHPIESVDFVEDPVAVSVTLLTVYVQGASFSLSEGSRVQYASGPNQIPHRLELRPVVNTDVHTMFPHLK